MNGSLQGNAQQVIRTGGFDLPCDAHTAFTLFSPEGEREWVPGWNPIAVYPETIAFTANTVFRLGQGSEESVWTILEADSQRHHAEYVRIAPASHAARINIKIEPVSPNRSHVIVSYTVTAFGEHTSTVLESFSEGAYAQRMREWQQQISTCLEIREQ
ncbi:MAG TPA: hypothetical protein VJP02_28315, partial [Candidatus Sulfotelmatobacter sp.]|nr:hypothetical protein [Candidatus Sulfotelmatobacter sp.]